MNCGVYQIENTVNGKLYIGSSNQIRRRFYLHKWDLRRGKHHSITLQRSWDKYGEASFTFTTLLYCTPTDRHFYEQLFLDALNTVNPENGYNICGYAENAGKGRVWTDEQKKAKSLERKGKKVSAATYFNLLNSRKYGSEHQFYGKHHTEESKKKMSDAMIGRKAWNKGMHTGNNQAKITPAQVLQMRTDSIINGMKPKALSEKYGLKPDTVWKICTGRLWPSVGGLA